MQALRYCLGGVPPNPIDLLLKVGEIRHIVHVCRIQRKGRVHPAKRSRHARPFGKWNLGILQQIFVAEHWQATDPSLWSHYGWRGGFYLCGLRRRTVLPSEPGRLGSSLGLLGTLFPHGLILRGRRRRSGGRWLAWGPTDGAWGWLRALDRSIRWRGRRADGGSLWNSAPILLTVRGRNLFGVPCQFRSPSLVRGLRRCGRRVVWGRATRTLHESLNCWHALHRRVDDRYP